MGRAGPKDPDLGETEMGESVLSPPGSLPPLAWPWRNRTEGLRGLDRGHPSRGQEGPLEEMFITVLSP